MILQGLQLHTAVEYEYKCTAGVKNDQTWVQPRFIFVIKGTGNSEEL